MSLKISKSIVFKALKIVWKYSLDNANFKGILVISLGVIFVLKKNLNLGECVYIFGG